MAQARLWAIVAAAGAGQGVAARVPKQYLKLLDKTVIEWALAPLLRRADVAGVVVVLAENDMQWRQLAASRDLRIRTAVGGALRADSVRAGLQALEPEAAAQDWVLVHDAARPC